LKRPALTRTERKIIVAIRKHLSGAEIF